MILVLGGTSDSLQICKVLSEKEIDYIVSVTTDYGKKLSLQYSSKVLEGKLDPEGMQKVIQAYDIECMIDATHPYAVEVSHNGMGVAQKLGIPYIRYERASLLERVDYKRVYVATTNQEAAQIAKEIGKTIFLSTGSKTLGEFVSLFKEEKVIARVLPTSEVILQCEKLGLMPDQIIGMKGPFTTSMNEMLFRAYGVECVITKESGMEGGFLEKIEACQRLGLPIVVIKRTSLNYPVVAHQVETVLELIDEMRRKDEKGSISN